MIAEIARNVAGDAAIIESITKPRAEIHDYQPTPGDIRREQDARLILWNGLDLERWFEKFFANLRDVPSVVVSDGEGGSSGLTAVAAYFSFCPMRDRPPHLGATLS